MDKAFKRLLICTLILIFNNFIATMVAIYYFADTNFGITLWFTLSNASMYWQLIISLILLHNSELNKHYDFSLRITSLILLITNELVATIIMGATFGHINSGIMLWLLLSNSSLISVSVFQFVENNENDEHHKILA